MDEASFCRFYLLPVDPEASRGADASHSPLIGHTNQTDVIDIQDEVTRLEPTWKRNSEVIGGGQSEQQQR